MKCSNPACGRDVAADSLFCPYCGTKMSAVCSSCGAALIPGALFCSKCGTRVGAPNVPPKAVPAASPAQPAPQTNAPKTFTPAAQPFFTKWIAEHREWAKSNGVKWISKFYGDYAVAITGKNGGFICYDLVKGEQDPVLFSVMRDPRANADAKECYSDKYDTFENGSPYFLYGFVLCKDNKDSLELMNDDAFLKSFGGENFGSENLAEKHPFYGVFHYDGTRLYKSATTATINRGGYLKFPPYGVIGNYVAVRNSKGSIPEKSFFPYDIIDPIKGEKVVSNVYLPYKIGEYGVFGNYLLSVNRECVFFLPYTEKITKYGYIFDNGLYITHENEWLKPHLKGLFTQTGKIFSGDDYDSYFRVDGRVVLVMRRPNGNYYFINEFGCELEFNTVVSGGNAPEYFDILQVNQRECAAIQTPYDPDNDDIYEVKVYKLFSIHSTEPSATLLGEFIARGWNTAFIEYSGKSYTAYENDSGAYVLDANFKQIANVKQAYNASLVVGKGDDNDILYLRYTTKDALREYLNFKDLNSNKTVITIPESKEFSSHYFSNTCVYKFNGFLFFAGDDWENIFLPNGTHISSKNGHYWNIMENFEYNKYKKLPKSKMILQTHRWEIDINYRIIDLKTGEHEEFHCDEEFRPKYGYEAD